MNEISFDVPEYYQPWFKGRSVKFCPVCNKKMEYDGWSIDNENTPQKIDEWWFCKYCKKMIKNPS